MSFLLTERNEMIKENFSPLLSARECRQLLGNVSAMTLWRWLNNDQLSFPRPTIIQQRRYWREVEIDNWLKVRALASLNGGAK